MKTGSMEGKIEMDTSTILRTKDYIDYEVFSDE